jgi:hypothetical protein
MVLVHRAVAEANSAVMPRGATGIVIAGALVSSRLHWVDAEAFATTMPRGATGVVLAGALASCELLVQGELVLPEQLASLDVRDVVSAAPIGTSRSVSGGAAVVEASGGAIGASGGAMAGRRGRPNIPESQVRRRGLKQPPYVPTTDLWSSSTSPNSPLGGVRQVTCEAW